jgi:ubiquinone biosynthesis protein
VLEETRRQGIIRRFLTTQRHLLGLIIGGAVARTRWQRQTGAPRGFGYALLVVFSLLTRPFLARGFARLPFAVQLRRRLEMLGPTYVKLGQVLSLRQDVLPPNITGELKNLLERLPVVTFERFAREVTESLGQPLEAMFLRVDPEPIGSASIAQVHRAVTLDGEEVILKAIKPRVRETIERDTILLRFFGRFLQTFLARYQPQRIIDEFCDYTLRELNLRREADNAETFAANFRDLPDVIFPRIHRRYSSRDVLCMDYIGGVPPDSPAARALPPAARERLIDLGAAAILRMLYRDGFFHADLHPGNLRLLVEGERVQVAFIDLGMVGRLDQDLRRTLLYYYFSLVMGDAENASRYLLAAAELGPGADAHGFRREAEEVSRRWRRAPTFEGFSIGQLILRSIAAGAHFRVYFPVELVLMVKAIITFEGVGHLLQPNFDVADVSQAHIRRLFLNQFSPLRLMREGLRGAPEIFDALVKAPLLVTEGLRVLETSRRPPRERPLSGLRGSLLAGASLIAGSVMVATDGPWVASVILFGLALVLALRRENR